MKSNMLTSNDFMHNVKDYVLPINVLARISSVANKPRPSILLFLIVR